VEKRSSPAKEREGGFLISRGHRTKWRKKKKNHLRGGKYPSAGGGGRRKRGKKRACLIRNRGRPHKKKSNTLLLYEGRERNSNPLMQKYYYPDPTMKTRKGIAPPVAERLVKFSRRRRRRCPVGGTGEQVYLTLGITPQGGRERLSMVRRSPKRREISRTIAREDRWPSEVERLKVEGRKLAQRKKALLPMQTKMLSPTHAPSSLIRKRGGDYAEAAFCRGGRGGGFQHNIYYF